MKRLILLFFCITALAEMYSQKKPNFIFILTDDQPYGYLGCEGNTIIQTPNIDQLAKEGMRFSNAHITSAICTPSRVSILLSQYERKHGVNFNSGTSVSDEAWADSYPMVMRKNGYYTGWIGKNHAPIGKGGYKSGVMEKSFDYWYAGHRHLSFYPKERHKIFKDAEKDTQVEILQEATLDFLDSNEKRLENVITFLEGRPENKPFMLSVNFNLPHDASAGTMKLRDSDDEIYKTLYRDINIPLPKNYIAKKDITSPKLPKGLLKTEERQDGYNYVDTEETLKERTILKYQAMTGIDRMIGVLRAKLKQINQDKNTVLVFTSDHGLFMGQFGLGGKSTCYEENTHVPFLFYNPKDKKKNKVSNALVQSIDIAPTLLSMANIAIPKSYQGKDLSNVLADKEKEVREYVYTENLWSTHFGNPRCEAVQNHKWKYIRYYKNENFSAKKKIKIAKEMNLPLIPMLYGVHDSHIVVYRDYVESPLNGEKPVYEELYDLKNDPEEATNLVEKFPQKVIEYRKVWLSEITKARGSGQPKVYRCTDDAVYSE